MPGGRPSIYTDEITQAICERLALGESLTAICKDPEMPGLTTVFQWLHDKPEFQKRYARAREEQAETLAAEIVAIADEDPGNTEHGKDGAAVQHQRLRVEARKWVAAKLKPKVYGDKQAIEHSGGITLEQILANSGATQPEQPT